jgi:hypothetical protein
VTFSKGVLTGVAVLALVAIFAGAAAWGQDTTGRVIGTIYDQQSKVVPGAKVTVTNAGTKISKTTVTNQDVYFEVLDLPIGSY